MKEKLSSPSRPSIAPPVEHWRPGKAVIAALLALITVVAVVARIHAITAKGFWGDEASSVAIARLPWADFARLLWHHEANMALYYLLLRFWLRLGTSEGTIRGLSALLSVATVPLVYALGRRLFGPSTGLLAAWLLAINAYHVRYAQEARSYALVVFLCALATWMLVRNLQGPSSAHWGVYAAACVCAAYSHFFGALVVLAHCISLLFLRRGEVPWRQILRSLLWFIYLIIPIEWFVASTGSDSVAWVSQMEASALLGFFSSLAGNYGISLLVLVAVAAALAALGGWSLWREDGPTLKTWAYALMFVWLLVPVLVVSAVSVVRPMFVARYLNPCLPALTLIVAAGITQLRPAVLAGMFCTAISVCSMLGTASYYRQDFDLGLERRDWRAATSFILDHAQPGDGVFFYGGSGHMLFEFFRHARRPAPAWPQVLESENGLDVSYGDFFYRDLDDVLRDSRPGGNRVWLALVYDTRPDGKPNQAGARIRELFGKERHLVEVRRFSDITVLLYARDATDSGRLADLGRLTGRLVSRLAPSVGCTNDVGRVGEPFKGFELGVRLPQPLRVFKGGASGSSVEVVNYRLLTSLNFCTLRPSTDSPT